MLYFIEVFYKEWFVFNFEKNKSKVVEMVYIFVEVYF